MKRLVTIMSIAALLTSVCAQQPESIDTTGQKTTVEKTAAESAPKRILLAMEKTAFKQELIVQMQSSLASRGHNVTVVENHKKQLNEHSASDYDLVFITNSGVNSKVRPWVKDWLSANEQHKNRILLHTTQTRDWEVEADVDVVTSASAKKDVKSLAATYTDKLLGLEQ